MSRRVTDELTRRLEMLKRRLERYQETDTSEQHEDLSKAALTRRTRSRASVEQELIVIDKQLRRIQNYPFEDALKDFEVANKSVALACRNFLPVELRGEIGADLDEAYGFVPEYGVPEQLNASAVTVWASTLLRSMLDELVYLGPLRDSPERHYIFSGNPSQHVGKTGRMVPDILFKNRELVEKVNEKFETFGVGYTLQVSSVTGDALELHDVYALRLADKYTGVAASILDVGFGISQLLPIIVQSLLAKDQTLCIEQPEIHLHPKLQAELGSLLAESIQAPLNNRFIVETHSEHLMMRIQRLIREKKLRSEDVSVVYVERTTEASKCIPLRLDSEGNFLDPWPGGFFEDAYQEIFK